MTAELLHCSRCWLLCTFLAVGIAACADESPPGEGCEGSECGTVDAEGRGRRGSDTDTGLDSASADAGADDAAVSTTDGASDTGASTPDTPVETPRGGGLRVEPESIILSAAGTGSIQEQIVQIFNETDQNVTFISADVQSDAPGFSLVQAPVNVVRAPGGVIGFKMVYEAASDDDVFATILVENSFGDAIMIPVTVAEKVEGNGCVRVTPTTVNFGTVTRGDPPVSQTVTIENCGEATINILGLERGRVFFLPTPISFQWTSDPLPIILTSGATSTVSVTYTARRAGAETGAMEVVSNVSGSERTRVTLRARSEPPPILDLDLHLVLEWDVSGGSDVDFHFYPESGELFSCDDCFYSNMSPDWGVAGDILDDPFLDYDDLEGPGPENINVSELPDGTYLIVAHYYSDTGSGGTDSSFSASTNATVAVYIDGSLADTFGPVNLGSTDKTWNVARLEWPSRTLTELGDVFSVNRGDYTWCGGLRL